MPSLRVLALFGSLLLAVQATIAPTITDKAAVRSFWSVNVSDGVHQYKGGQTVTVKWVEDDAKPLSKAFGATDVALMVGSTNSQFVVQDIGTVQNPSKTKSLKWKVDPDAGPDMDTYFLRFQSVSETDNGVPLQAFSARFSLSEMTGKLSAAASAAVAGVSPSDGASATKASGASGASGSASATSLAGVNKAALPSSSASASGSSASQNESSNAVAVRVAGGVVFSAVASLWLAL